MARTLFISLLVFGVLLLALGGWAVRGARWAARPMGVVRLAA